MIDPDDVVKLNRLTWESLPADFTGPKHRMTTADWDAWAGYDPNDCDGERFKRGAADRFAHLTPAEQARCGIRWWDAWR